MAAVDSAPGWSLQDGGTSETTLVPLPLNGPWYTEYVNAAAPGAPQAIAGALSDRRWIGSRSGRDVSGGRKAGTVRPPRIGAAIGSAVDTIDVNGDHAGTWIFWDLQRGYVVSLSSADLEPAEVQAMVDEVAAVPAGEWQAAFRSATD